MKVEFTKMNGLGNDYIYVNANNFQISDPQKVSRLWSDRHRGIGADGLVLISDSQIADFRMQMFNADGSQGRMCGNAARCIARYVYERGLTSKKDITLETLSGIKTLRVHTGADGKVRGVTVGMGKAILSDTEMVATDSGNLQGFRFDIPGVPQGAVFVNMGNPHAVFFVPDATAVELEKVGPQVEHHAVFPQRVNAEFASVLPDGKIRMRVWERGSGITMACGTGACATAVAAATLGIAGEKSDQGISVSIVMDGGQLDIVYTDDYQVFMTGPAEFVFDGEIELDD